MKKLRTYIVLIVILLTFASGLYYFTHTGKFSLGSFDSIFLSQGTDLKHIEISGPNNQSIILSNINGDWIVQGEYSANNKAIDALFYVLRHTIKKAPVPKSRYHAVQQKVENKALHISLITEDEEKTSFSLYEKQSNKKFETYLQLKSDPEIVLVECLGINNGILQYFSPKMIHWIDNILFHLEAKDINEINVKSPDSSNKSYKITQQENTIKLFSLCDSLRPEKYDSLNVQAYLHWFQNVSYADCLANKHLKDSLLSNIEYSSIQIQTIKGVQIKVRTWMIPLQSENPNDQVQFDLNYMYAMTQQEDLVYKVSFLQFDPLLMELDYFLQKKK